MNTCKRCGLSLAESTGGSYCPHCGWRPESTVAFHTEQDMAELSRLREFKATVVKIERIRSQEFADGDSLDEDILVGMLRDIDTALTRLDDGRKR